MSLLPVFSIQKMKKIENKIIDSGISEIELLHNAGLSSAEIIYEKVNISKLDKIIFICGKGNNGGEGIVAANELVKKGYDISVYFVVDNPDVSMFHTDLKFLKKITDLASFDIIVDAIFGIGLNRAFGDEYIDIIKEINNSNAKKISLDMPSGIQNFDESGICVNADYTIAMGALNEFNIKHPYKEFNGDLFVAKIIADDEIFKKNAEVFFYNDEKSDNFFEMDYKLNKYSRGKLLVIGGSKSMKGALGLVAASAMKFCGALKVVTVDSAECLIENMVPEAVKYYVTKDDVLAIDDFLSIKEHLLWAETIVIGNGMGRNLKTIDLINKIFSFIQTNCSGKRIVVDGDAIFAFSKFIFIPKYNEFIFTPHNGELLNLLDNTKCRTGKEFVEKFNAILIQKDENCSVIFKNGQYVINNKGSVELSKFGSGDVLAGMLGGILSLKKPINKSVNKAVYLHGFVARSLAEEYGPVVITAHELVNNIYKYFYKKGRNVNA